MQIERDTVESCLVRDVPVWYEYIILNLLMGCASEFPDPPFQTVGPVDEIKMAYIYQCAFVFAPLTTWDTCDDRQWFASLRLDPYLTSPSFSACSSSLMIS